jgi:hypothetical protein
MLFSARATFAFISCAALVTAAACGGSSTSPSRFSSAGAIIAGTVVTGESASTGGVSARTSGRWANTLPVPGLTVKLQGTNRSASVSETGTFELRGVPAGNARLHFSGGGVDSTVDVTGVTTDQFIELTLQLTGSTVVAVEEARSGKVRICHAEGTGVFHQIEISESAEPAHRAHGDGKIGEPVPGQPDAQFGDNCRVVGPSVDIQKLTNNQDADVAPGPRIPVGSPVVWKYVVTNNGSVNISNIVVVDDQGVVVDCAGQTQLWLMPPWLGTKIMAIGATCAMSCAS